MANQLDKRLKQIEDGFTDKQKIRFFILNDGVYTCMATRRKSDNLDDLRTANEKCIVYDIINPEPDDDS